MPAGRPTEYKAEYCEVAATMALNGATDAEIADELSVSVMSLWRWRGKYPEFREALRYGKENADERVERSLYQRSCEINGASEPNNSPISFYERP